MRHPINLRRKPVPFAIMRLFVAFALALVSAVVSTGQTPTSIKDVAKLVEMRTHRGVTFPVFNYQGVFVEGDVSLQDYNDATAVVRRESRDGEQIIGVVASQQVPTWSENGKDLIVRTCTTSCGPQPAGVTADGRIQFVVGGGEGRQFIFERVSGKLRLDVVVDWIA